MKNHPLHSIRENKLKSILFVFWTVTCILLFRLFYLQVDRRFMFSHLGEKNFLRIEIISPLRGDVYDCNHELLAANQPVFDLYWQGLGIRKLSQCEENTLCTLSSILNIDFNEKEKKSSLEYIERYGRRILLKADISFEQLCQISERCLESQHLVITNRFKRIYPHNHLACHVLGYLSRGENIGQSGIERSLDESLQGKKGRISYVINSTGKTLIKKIYQQAQAGIDIELTLDMKLQQIAESLFQLDQSGTFILMDPEDGSVKTLVSYPGFDPNIFLKPITPEEWEQITNNNPLINRATCSLLPPASVFKLVTITAGLEEKIITPNTEIMCNGFFPFCGRKYLCMKHEGHGLLNPKKAIAYSCNIPCFHIARHISIDCLASYAKRFGLGQKTNFILPEKDGLIPTSIWKKRVKKERWWGGETLSACIGQSYLLVTPLQIARMVGSICTGFLVKPHLLTTETIEKKPLEISRETLSLLRGGMKEAVNVGTGRMLCSLSSFSISLKTGTAQTCSLTKEKVYKHQLEHGWVACYFSYQGQKPLVILALVENAGTSHVALHMVDRFLRSYETLMKQSVNRPS